MFYLFLSATDVLLSLLVILLFLFSSSKKLLGLRHKIPSEIKEKWPYFVSRTPHISSATKPTEIPSTPSVEEIGVISFLHDCMELI